MPTSRSSRLSTITVSLVAVSVSALLLGVLGTAPIAHAAAEADGGDRTGFHQHSIAQPGTTGRRARAESALDRATRAFAWSTPSFDRPDASLALRKLWMLRSSLSPSDRQVADRIGGRPSSDQVDCTSAIACIHWNSSTSTAAWAATVRDTIDYVGNTYRAAGYKATVSDGDAGGGPQTDVYIAPLQPGLYGYCKPTGKFKRGTHAAPAFCVLDNDYAGFPEHTPLENLQVTAAHEFFHATQFAYDVLDDTWFLEATAVWMEDEVYPDVNDNLQYLANSPITRPKQSLDTFESGGSFHYGIWNFFRYLTEKYPALEGPLPSLILHMWQKADSTNGRKKDKYSLQAINTALRRDDDTTLAGEFALYTDAVRRTHTTFAEGAALDYPVKRLAGKKTMGPGAKEKFHTHLDHLTSATYRFDSAGLPLGTKMKLHFAMAPRSTGSEIVISTYLVDGEVQTKLLKVNKAGKRSRKVYMGSERVAAVEVTLVNAGRKFRECDENRTDYSCGGGVPVDQREQEKLAARVLG